MKKILAAIGMLFAVYVSLNVIFSDHDSADADSAENEAFLDEGRVVECFMCHGDGVCSNCNGEGFRNGRRCHSCKGNGKCDVCGGKGVREVYVYNGVDYVKCSSCSGSGECSTCDGTGEYEYNIKLEYIDDDCFICYGSGRCNKCRGEGYTVLSEF